MILFNFILLNDTQIVNPPQSRACFRSVVVITSASHAEGRRFKSCRKQNAFLTNLYLKPNGHNSRFLILNSATPCLFQPETHKRLKRVTAPCVLGNKLMNIRFPKYHIWNNKRETFNQSVRKNTVTQYHQCSRAKLTGARGFQI